MVEKVIGVCDKIEWTKKPFEKYKYYPIKILQDVYKKLFLKGEKHNLRFIETNFEWYDWKKGIFEKGWMYKKGGVKVSGF